MVTFGFLVDLYLFSIKVRSTVYKYINVHVAYSESSPNILEALSVMKGKHSVALMVKLS